MDLAYFLTVFGIPALLTLSGLFTAGWFFRRKQFLAGYLLGLLPIIIALLGVETAIYARCQDCFRQTGHALCCEWTGLEMAVMAVIGAGAAVLYLILAGGLYFWMKRKNR